MTTIALPAPTSAPTAAARTFRRDLAAVPRALSGEWIKLSTVRSTAAIGWITLALGFVTSWAVATFVTDEVQTVAEVFIFSTVLTGVLASISGVLLFTSEAQHGTLAGTLTAQPTRWVVVAAKAVLAAGRGLWLGAAGIVGGTVGAVAGGLAWGDTSGMVRTTAWALVFTALAAVLGLGVGLIVRHGSAALTGVLVWGLVVENLLTVFLSDNVSRFLPFVAGNNLLAIEGEGAFAESAASILPRTVDALVFGGYTAAALLLGTVLLYRRDVD